MRLPFLYETTGGEHMPAYQVTGNEYLSLPAIAENTGAVEGLTVLHMGAKGLLELGGGDRPLAAPGWRVYGVSGRKKLPVHLCYTENYLSEISVRGCMAAPVFVQIQIGSAVFGG